MDANSPVAATLSLAEALAVSQADPAQFALAAQTLLQELNGLARRCLGSRDAATREDAISQILEAWSRGQIKPREGGERAYLARCLRNAAATVDRSRYAKGREMPTGDDVEPLASDEPSAAERLERANHREALAARFASAFDAYEAHLDRRSGRRDVARMDRVVLQVHRQLVRGETTLEGWYDEITSTDPVARNTVQQRVTSFRKRFIAFVNDPECTLDPEAREASRDLIERLRVLGSTSGRRGKDAREGTS